MSAVLWDVASGKEANAFPLAMSPLSFHMSSTENRLVVAGSSVWPGELACLDLKSGKKLWSTKGKRRFQYFVFSQNGKLGLSALGLDSEIPPHIQMDLILWDTENGKELRRLRPIIAREPSFEPPFK